MYLFSETPQMDFYRKYQDKWYSSSLQETYFKVLDTSSAIYSIIS